MLLQLFEISSQNLIFFLSVTHNSVVPGSSLGKVFSLAISALSVELGGPKFDTLFQRVVAGCLKNLSAPSFKFQVWEIIIELLLLRSYLHI